MKLKKSIKKILRKTAFLHNNLSQISSEAAQSILDSFSVDPLTTCVANNILDLQYDLQIIVPVYNQEKYISQCLDSALNQKTEFSYLITVVNDGSTDRSLEIIQSYKERYGKRLEIIDQKNKGFSGARNVAMKVLKGKYVTFLDSDDILEDGAVEALLNATQKSDKQIDIVQGSWYNGIELGGGRLHDIQIADQPSGYPWGKIYKAEILEHFQFPEGYWFEDTPISFMLYGKNYNFSIIPNVVYGYRLNPEGITTKSRGSKRSVESYYITALCLREFPDFNVAYDQRAYEYFLNQCVMNWSRTAKLPKNVREAIFVLENELRKKYFKNMHSEHYKEIENCLKNIQFNKFEILMRTR